MRRSVVTTRLVTRPSEKRFTTRYVCFVSPEPLVVSPLAIAVSDSLGSRTMSVTRLRAV